MQTETAVFGSDALRVMRHSTAFCSAKLFSATSAHISNLGQAFGCDWPARSGATAHSGTILGLSPNEWAMVQWDAAAVQAKFAQACEGTLFDVNDLSGGYAAYQISGAAARLFLAKSCSLDFHPLVFQEAYCAQTLFAQVSALIVRPGPELKYDIYVESSLIQYLDAWMLDSAVVGMS